MLGLMKCPVKSSSLCVFLLDVPHLCDLRDMSTNDNVEGASNDGGKHRVLEAQVRGRSPSDSGQVRLPSITTHLS